MLKAVEQLARLATESAITAASSARSSSMMTPMPYSVSAYVGICTVQSIAGSPTKSERKLMRDSAGEISLCSRMR
jgi:hypothetical protein